MNTAALPDLIGGFVGLFLTLSVFSYLIGDNALFRLAIHILIGVAAGFAAVTAWYSVIWPQLVLPLWQDSGPERLLLLIPLVLGLLLLTKASPGLSGLGSLVVAILVGVGAAVVVGGAVSGTLFPQAAAAVNDFDMPGLTATGESPVFNLANSLLMLVGALATLAYFHFGGRPQPGEGARRAAWIDNLAWVGQFFIAITFGAIFAGVIAAALVAFIERWIFMVDFIRPLIVGQ